MKINSDSTVLECQESKNLKDFPILKEKVEMPQKSLKDYYIINPGYKKYNYFPACTEVSNRGSIALHPHFHFRHHSPLTNILNICTVSLQSTISTGLNHYMNTQYISSCITVRSNTPSKYI